MTLEELRDRVRAATGPDRELATDLWREFSEDARYNPREIVLQAVGRLDWPDMTASINTALALSESVLPGWDKRLDIYQDRVNFLTSPPGYGFYKAFETVGIYNRPTPSLAILDALLTALIEQQKAEAA